MQELYSHKKTKIYNLRKFLFVEVSQSLAGRAKTTSSTARICQILHFLLLRLEHRSNDKLRNPLAGLQSLWQLAMIQQDNLDFATVV